MGKKVTQEKKPTYVDNMIRWSRVKRNGTRDAHYEGHRGGGDVLAQTALKGHG